MGQPVPVSPLEIITHKAKAALRPLPGAVTGAVKLS